MEQEMESEPNTSASTHTKRAQMCPSRRANSTDRWPGWRTRLVASGRQLNRLIGFLLALAVLIVHDNQARLGAARCAVQPSSSACPPASLALAAQASPAGNSSEHAPSAPPTLPEPASAFAPKARSANISELLVGHVQANLARSIKLDVLCNSHCSCVISELESLAQNATGEPAQQASFNEDYALDYDAGLAEPTGVRRDPSSGASNATAPAARQAQPSPSMGLKDEPPARRLRPEASSVPKTSGLAGKQPHQQQALTLFPGSHLDKASLHESHRLAAIHGLRTEQVPPIQLDPSLIQLKHTATPGGNPYAHLHLLPNYLRRMGHGQEEDEPAELARLEPDRSRPMRLRPLKTIDCSAKLRLVRNQPDLDAPGEHRSSPATTETEQPDALSEESPSGWTENVQVADQASQLLARLVADGAQSLVLRNNEMQFELWSELYTLLALPLRHQLFHLDLSRNSLSKLGVTFTGYIERHLAARQLNTWPFAPNQDSSPASSDVQAGANKMQTLTFKRTRTRYSIGNGGRLYNAVMERHIAYLNELNDSSTEHQPPTSAGNGHSASHNSTQQLASILQQPMLLRGLDLSHNKLKWLISDQFRSIKHVQTIRLDFNKIRYIHQHAFDGLEYLRYVNLNSNKLQVIYIEQFQSNYKLLVSGSYLAKVSRL